MNAVLLDSHVLLWWYQGGENLSGKARAAIADESARVFISAASLWEIAIKFRAGKLQAAEPLISRFDSIVAASGFAELPVSIAHGIRAGLLGAPHKDPFDRMLAAQAQLENLPLVSNDRVFDRFPVRRIW